MIRVGDKEIDAIYYVDDEGVEREVEAVYLGEEKVWPENVAIESKLRLVGSFMESAESQEDRYVWINGVKHYLDVDFDYQSDETWLYGESESSNTSFFSQPLKSLTIVKGANSLKTLAYAFIYNKITDAPGLANCTFEDVTTMEAMFRGCNGITILDVANWKTKEVVSMAEMFNGCSGLSTIDGIEDWDVSNVRAMDLMFDSCRNLYINDLSKWNLESVTNMTSMFYGGLASGKDFTAKNWNVQNATKLVNVFGSCQAGNLYLSGWNTKTIENMNQMFSSVRANNIDLSGWDVSNVTTMSKMFNGCRMVTLNISGWDLKKATSVGDMFSRCLYLTTIIGPVYNISSSIDLQYSPLTVDSAMVFINGLKDGTEGLTLTLKSTTYDSLTPEQLAIGTAKGWTIVSA